MQESVLQAQTGGCCIVIYNALALYIIVVAKDEKSCLMDSTALGGTS